GHFTRPRVGSARPAPFFPLFPLWGPAFFWFLGVVVGCVCGGWGVGGWCWVWSWGGVWVGWFWLCWCCGLLCFVWWWCVFLLLGWWCLWWLLLWVGCCVWGCCVWLWLFGCGCLGLVRW
ncbi:hypothetical protein RA267_27625, partial [Pseudomonas syringae pv. tagetis]|uniref:hypothetical protein n=1 Tax=Pseudomonas syringae group genomosp. 7 TaxID=251699 RepID=UPI00376FB4C3